MASTIKIKNSSTAGAVPSAGDLVQGELAVNVTDKTIFTENASGTVVELGKNYTGFKNRIINGAMMIDQRNAGASVSGDGSFAVDRFNSFKNTGTYTGQRSTDAPAGFTNSYLYTNTSAVTTTYAAIAQIVEGFNVADFGWGTANAASITLSFWVKSSLTGTFGVSFRNSASDRSYVASYTINSANTWEQKSVTIAGDTSGTWLKDNGAGIRLWWDLGVGSGSSTTAGSWQAGNYYGLTSGTKLTGTNGATFYITGVQLEKGSTATSFDYRPYGTELQLCQRYYQKTDYLGTGVANATTTAALITPYLQPMRATPTASVGGTTWAISDNFVADADAASPTIVAVFAISNTSCRYSIGGFTGLTAGRWYGSRPVSTSLIAFSAEL